MKIADIQARLEDISIEVEALADIQGDEPTQEQQDQFLALNSEEKELEVKLDSAKVFQAAKEEVVARPAASVQPAENVQPNTANKVDEKMNKQPAAQKDTSDNEFTSS